MNFAATQAGVTVPEPIRTPASTPAQEPAALVAGRAWKIDWLVALILPVLLGIVGGFGLLIGPAGLFVLAQRRDVVLTDAARRGMDTAFLAMLFLTSLTGFALMVLRDTGAMGILLALHLGVVLALFLSLPYGKFVHGLYRYLALVKYAREKREATFVE